MYPPMGIPSFSSCESNVPWGSPWPFPVRPTTGFNRSIMGSPIEGLLAFHAPSRIPSDILWEGPHGKAHMGSYSSHWTYRERGELAWEQLSDPMALLWGSQWAFRWKVAEPMRRLIGSMMNPMGNSMGRTMGSLTCTTMHTMRSPMQRHNPPMGRSLIGIHMASSMRFMRRTMHPM